MEWSPHSSDLSSFCFFFLYSLKNIKKKKILTENQKYIRIIECEKRKGEYAKIEGNVELLHQV